MTNIILFKQYSKLYLKIKNIFKRKIYKDLQPTDKKKIKYYKFLMYQIILEIFTNNIFTEK